MPRPSSYSPTSSHGWTSAWKRGLQRPVYFHAFRDIVVSIRMHLGMKVEHGLYGRSQQIGHDGKAIASGSRVILLEAKTAPRPVPSVHQLGSHA